MMFCPWFLHLFIWSPPPRARAFQAIHLANRLDRCNRFVRYLILWNPLLWDLRTRQDCSSVILFRTPSKASAKSQAKRAFVVPSEARSRRRPTRRKELEVIDAVVVEEETRRGCWSTVGIQELENGDLVGDKKPNLIVYGVTVMAFVFGWVWVAVAQNIVGPVLVIWLSTFLLSHAALQPSFRGYKIVLNATTIRFERRGLSWFLGLPASIAEVELTEITSVGVAYDSKSFNTSFLSFRTTTREYVSTHYACEDPFLKPDDDATFWVNAINARSPNTECRHLDPVHYKIRPYPRIYCLLCCS